MYSYRPSAVLLQSLFEFAKHSCHIICSNNELDDTPQIHSVHPCPDIALHNTTNKHFVIWYKGRYTLHKSLGH